MSSSCTRAAPHSSAGVFAPSAALWSQAGREQVWIFFALAHGFCESHALIRFDISVVALRYTRRFDFSRHALSGVSRFCVVGFTWERLL